MDGSRLRESDSCDDQNGYGDKRDSECLEPGHLEFASVEVRAGALLANNRNALPKFHVIAGCAPAPSGRGLYSSSPIVVLNTNAPSTIPFRPAGCDRRGLAMGLTNGVVRNRQEHNRSLTHRRLTRVAAGDGG